MNLESLKQAPAISEEKPSSPIIASQVPHKNLNAPLANANSAPATNKEEINTLSAPTTMPETSVGRELALSKSLPEQEINGKVLSESGQPLANARIMTRQKTGTTTDEEGNFKLKTNDTSVNVTIASANKINETARLRSANPNNIVVLESEERKFQKMLPKKSEVVSKDLSATTNYQPCWRLAEVLSIPGECYFNSIKGITSTIWKRNLRLYN